MEELEACSAAVEADMHSHVEVDDDENEQDVVGEELELEVDGTEPISKDTQQVAAELRQEPYDPNEVDESDERDKWEKVDELEAIVEPNEAGTQESFAENDTAAGKEQAS